MVCGLGLYPAVAGGGRCAYPRAARFRQGRTDRVECQCRGHPESDDGQRLDPVFRALRRRLARDFHTGRPGRVDLRARERSRAAFRTGRCIRASCGATSRRTGRIAHATPRQTLTQSRQVITQSNARHRYNVARRRFSSVGRATAL